MGVHKVPFHLLLLLLISLYSIEGVLATVTPYLNPGFQFDYDKPGQPFSIPVTSQCERIHLKWSRENNNTGRPPVAPYFLQVYTSTFSTPFYVEAGFGPSFDWDVPFAPNTLYQICMFDINNVSGGCQATYTVIANSTVDKPTCQNVTAPTALSVSGTVPTGLLSQYSYIDQCTSLSVTPKTGSPPYILTVAPSSHPPYNITSKTMDPISWTVSLPVGSHFFLSLESADGQKWSNGPMRVGGLGPVVCLAPGTILKSDSDKIIIGSTVGGTFFGLAVGFLSYLIFVRLRRRRRMAPSQTYFEREHFSSEDPARPVKTGTPAPSTISPFSDQSSPSLATIPLTMTPSTRTSELPLLTPPLEPLRPSRRRNRSVEPYTVPPSEASSTLTRYPADVKRPPPASDTSLFSRDDSDSLVSSSTGANSRRPLSVHSRAPTYVPRMTQPVRGRPGSRGAAAVIEEVDPPQYGNHTADPALKYAPSILSSGNRF